jgi:hypothetical protein
MQLHLLHTTSCLSIYYDSCHDWLFLDWAGYLALPLVQEACVAVAQCYLQRTYSRVLSSNLQVTDISWNVATWLGTEFLPYLKAAGVQHVAWISAPSLVDRNLGQRELKLVPELGLNLFDNAEEAIAWLQQRPSVQSEPYSFPQRQPAAQAWSAQRGKILRQEVFQLPQRIEKRLVESLQS